MKLEEMEKLCEAATPGPWDYSFTRTGIEVELTEANAQETIDNVRFITAARPCMPKLIEVAKWAKYAMGQVGCKFDHPDCPTCMLMAALEKLEQD